MEGPRAPRLAAASAALPRLARRCACSRRRRRCVAEAIPRHPPCVRHPRRRHRLPGTRLPCRGCRLAHCRRWDRGALSGVRLWPSMGGGLPQEPPARMQTLLTCALAPPSAQPLPQVTPSTAIVGRYTPAPRGAYKPGAKTPAEAKHNLEVGAVIAGGAPAVPRTVLACSRALCALRRPGRASAAVGRSGATPAASRPTAPMAAPPPARGAAPLPAALIPCSGSPAPHACCPHRSCAAATAAPCASSPCWQTQLPSPTERCGTCRRPRSAGSQLVAATSAAALSSAAAHCISGAPRNPRVPRHGGDGRGRQRQRDRAACPPVSLASLACRMCGAPAASRWWATRRTPWCRRWARGPARPSRTLWSWPRWGRAGREGPAGRQAARQGCLQQPHWWHVHGPLGHWEPRQPVRLVRLLPLCHLASCHAPPSAEPCRRHCTRRLPPKRPLPTAPPAWPSWAAPSWRRCCGATRRPVGPTPPACATSPRPHSTMPWGRAGGGA